MKATVALINFKDKTRLAKVQRTLLPMGYRMKRIQKEQYLQPVGYLMGEKDIAPVDAIYDGEGLEEEMMVLGGFTSGQIDQLIMSLRKSGVGKINYKAVLTETNQHWSVIELYHEIAKEHEAMSK